MAGLVGALRSGDVDAGGRRALGALADLELNALPLFEAAEARGVDFGVVDDNVGAVAVLGDEAVALLPVERDRTLARGGSIWWATAHGLERRVDPTVTAAFESATGTGDVASAELTEAWIRAYGRDPDPSDAWDHAIKAVEAILIPIVVSEQDKPQLGHVIGALDRRGHLWRLGLPGADAGQSVAPLVAMLRLMWPNPDRHGGSPEHHRVPTIEETRSVVHLAVTIAQWGREGMIVSNRHRSITGRQRLR